MRTLLGAERSRMFAIVTGAAVVSCLVLVGVASTLVVEVTRAGVLSGPASTTRSISRKG